MDGHLFDEHGYNKLKSALHLNHPTNLCEIEIFGKQDADLEPLFEVIKWGHQLCKLLWALRDFYPMITGNV